MSELIKDIPFIENEILNQRIKNELKYVIANSADPSRNTQTFSGFDKDNIVYYNYADNQYAVKSKSTLTYLTEQEIDVWLIRRSAPARDIAISTSSCNSINFVTDLNCDPRLIPNGTEAILKLDPATLCDFINAMQQQITTNLDSMNEEQLKDHLYKQRAEEIITSKWTANKRIKVLDAYREKAQLVKSEKKLKKQAKAEAAKARITKRAGIEADPLYAKYKDDKNRIKFFTAMSWSLADPEAHAKYDLMNS